MFGTGAVLFANLWDAWSPFLIPFVVVCIVIVLWKEFVK